MKKIKTYALYLYEYLKHGDFISIIASIRYVINKTSHSHDRVITTSIGKFYCRKNTNDFQFANYYYEWGVKRYLLNNSKNYNVFIDAGACVGDYCILLSKFNFRCFAFEPVGGTYDVLAKNLQLNNLTGVVKAFPYGLGEKDQTVGFIFDPVNTGASHVSKTPSKYDLIVDIRKFDSIYRNLNIKPEDNILFMIDIEGMESEAIRGAKEFISTFPNITFVMEDKHTGQNPIQIALRDYANFEFGIVDEFNMYAKKTGNLDK